MRGSSQQFADWIVRPTIERLPLKKIDSETTVDLLVSIAATESDGLSSLAAPPRGRERPWPSFGPYRFQDSLISFINDLVDDTLAGVPDKDIEDSLIRFNDDYRREEPDASIFTVWLDAATAYARIALWYDKDDYAPPVGDLREQYELYLSLLDQPKHPAFSLWVENRANWDGDAALLARYGTRTYLRFRQARAESWKETRPARPPHHYTGVEVLVG